MGKSVAKSLGIMVGLWVLLVLLPGNLFIIDSIVPTRGTTIDEWINAFYMSGFISGIFGFICAVIWHFFGARYTGGKGIRFLYIALLAGSCILGVIAAFFVILPSIDGAGFSFLLVLLVSALTFYISSLFACAEPVKYIPPFASSVH